MKAAISSLEYVLSPNVDCFWKRATLQVIRQVNGFLIKRHVRFQRLRNFAIIAR